MAAGKGDDWNASIIAEFRDNGGRVGGHFAGAPMLLLHHRGRKSQREYVIPLVYLPHDTDADTVYIIASSYGAPSNPDWYLNLMAAGTATIERDAETYEVTIREVAGEERNRLYLEQARRRSAFIGYAGKTAGVRVIPVLELRRA